VSRLLKQGRQLTDHYEIKELLGSGTSGQVYHGVHRQTGKDWAIKIVDSKKLAVGKNGADGAKSELVKEAELLRNLRHPNIIHLEDIFSDRWKVYLVMELSSGGDLFDRTVQKKRYSEKEALVVMRQILAAIAYLHEQNIAHRDLKLENILLASAHSDVDVKLTDFGLARQLEDGDRMKTYCGTPQYFAPEVLQRKNTVYGSGTYSLAADMWSLGVVAFVLLEGSYPFKDGTLNQQIMQAGYSFSAPAWSKVSAEAKDFVTQLLVVDPTRRLTAAQATAHPWICRGTSSSSSSSMNRNRNKDTTGSGGYNSNGHSSGSGVSGDSNGRSSSDKAQKSLFQAAVGSRSMKSPTTSTTTAAGSGADPKGTIAANAAALSMGPPAARPAAATSAAAMRGTPNNVTAAKGTARNTTASANSTSKKKKRPLPSPASAPAPTSQRKAAAASSSGKRTRQIDSYFEPQPQEPLTTRRLTRSTSALAQADSKSINNGKNDTSESK